MRNNDVLYRFPSIFWKKIVLLNKSFRFFFVKTKYKF